MTATACPVNRYLLDFIVDQAIWDINEDALLLCDIDENWMKRAVAWSFTWQEEFNKLNKDEIQGLVSDVMDEVTSSLDDIEDLCYRMKWELSLR